LVKQRSFTIHWGDAHIPYIEIERISHSLGTFMVKQLLQVAESHNRSDFLSALTFTFRGIPWYSIGKPSTV
jgi:hypothetical protein